MTTTSLLQIGGRGARGAAREAEAHRERAERWSALRPQRAQLYVENRCHLKCDHCYETSATHPAGGQLSLAEWQDVLDQLADLGVLYLTITGGEIFLRKDVFDIIAYARRKRFAVSLFTSGTLIDEARADRIRELGVSEVHISVYSDVAHDHDEFTGVPGSHAKSLASLRMFAARGVNTVMKTNLMTFNVDRIDAWIALANELGADWQVDPTVKPRMNGDRSPTNLAVSADAARRALLGRPHLVPSFRRRTPGDLCDGSAVVLDDDKPMCGAARSTLSIAADGKVSACGFFPVHGGDLRRQRLADVWFGSQQFDDVRQTSIASMNACPTCDVRSTCSPCMAYALVEHGDHRSCSTPARMSADALRSIAEARVVAERKLARGRALPIVGELHAPAPPEKRGVPAASTE